MLSNRTLGVHTIITRTQGNNALNAAHVIISIVLLLRSWKLIYIKKILCESVPRRMFVGSSTDAGARTQFSQSTSLFVTIRFRWFAFSSHDTAPPHAQVGITSTSAAVLDAFIGSLQRLSAILATLSDHLVSLPSLTAPRTANFNLWPTCRPMAYR